MSYQATGWVLEFSESRLGARLVLHEIAYRLNIETGICYPSLETIAHECRMSKSSTIEAIERLEHSGELAVDREDSPGSGNVNKYSMPLFWDWWKQAREIPQKGRKGKDDSEKGQDEHKKGSAALPEPEVEPEVEPSTPVGACPECGARQDLCMGHRKKKVKTWPKRGPFRKEAHVESEPKRSRGEEARARRAEAIENLRRRWTSPGSVR